ncbi:hypothetical protein GOL39_26110 [Sinorhizobium medicae]|nr:hypothetical protein [Sinorhizobium medicae]
MLRPPAPKESARIFDMLRTAHPKEGETLTSLCSRVAAANGRTMDEFCRDMALKTQEVIDGDAEAVQRVAVAVRVPVADLERITIIRRGGSSCVYNGESFLSPYFQRTSFRFCPRCLEEDMSDTSSRPNTRRYGRAIWSSRFIRTCVAHQWSMADAGRAPNTHWNYDFCLLLDRLRSEIKRASERSRAQVPTAFERFATDRFSRVKGHGDFLDTLGLQAGADLCVLSGMALRNGKRYRSLRRSEPEWHEAAQLYEFLCRGLTGWNEILEFCCNTTDQSKSLLGGDAIYGQLHSSLAKYRPGADYDRIRMDMRKFAIDRLDLTSETVIFGEKVSTSRISSNQVNERFGRDSRYIRKLLLADGAPGAAERKKGGVTFDETAAMLAAKKLGDAVKASEAGRLLGVGLSTQHIIINDGHLAPMVERNRPIKLSRLFSRTEIQRLLDRVLPEVPCTDVTGLYPFETATRRANARQSEVLNLLIQRKLLRVGVDREHHGIGSLLIDPTEVAIHTRLPDHGCLTLDEVRAAMVTGYSVVKALGVNGYLLTRSERNPVNRARQMVVHPTELDRFQSMYISFDRIMVEQKITRPRLSSLLKAHSISPALPVETIRVSFFRRSEIEVIFTAR